MTCEVFELKELLLEHYQIREVLRCLLHTIMFHRALGLVRPKSIDSELFDITYVQCGDAEVERQIEEKIGQFSLWLEKNPTKKGQICLSFFEKRRPITSSSSSATSSGEQTAWIKKNAEAYLYLLNSVQDQYAKSLLTCASHPDSAKRAWERLTRLHQPRTESTKAEMWGKISNLRMEQKETIPEYLERAEILLNDADVIEVTVPEELFITILLAGLSSEWIQMRSTIQAFPEKQKTRDFIFNTLINEHQTRELAKSKEENNKPACFAMTSSAPTSTFDPDYWYLDSGCDQHMTPNSSLLHSLTTTGVKSVTVANKESTPTAGEGILTFLNPTGKPVSISGVLLVPNLGANLLSVGQLEEKDCIFSFESGTVQIRYQGLLIARGERVGRLYRLKLDVNPETHHNTRSGALSKCTCWRYHTISTYT
ncbi:unnamed protein product [Closterium sp. NIES-65]|nr:unnamed protein product [Closterium sp. NIES-65]